MSRNNVVKLRSQAASPKVVNVTTTSASLNYMRELVRLGALEGAAGSQSVSAELAPLLEAVHEVLAGGSVEVKVTRHGNAKVAADLKEKADQVLREANDVNCSVGKEVPLWL